VKLHSRKPVSSDDNIGRGMDLALVTLVFLGVGYLLDRIFDTKPVFMIIMVVLAIVGLTARMWYGYEAQMRDHEADREAQRKARSR
jgi:F0F1-type ATP synthase assembly protein I